MKKYIIPGLALILLGGLGLFIKPQRLTTPTATSTQIGINPTISLPNLSDASVEAQAWGNFQDYVKSAKNHDLDSLRKFSYQLSPACSDQSRTNECTDLMDGLTAIAQYFRQADFKNIAYDDKQVVMSTDYMMIEEPTKVVLYFVRAENKFPKMLGIRLCYGDEMKSGEKCVDTDKATRDLNNNGWWDDVEELFN